MPPIPNVGNSFEEFDESQYRSHKQYRFRTEIAEEASHPKRERSAILTEESDIVPVRKYTRASRIKTSTSNCYIEYDEQRWITQTSQTNIR
jgi:hypothetical protein